MFNWYWTDARNAFERALEFRRANVGEFGNYVWLNSFEALEWLEVAVENARNHEPEPSFYVLMDLKKNVANDPVLEQPAFVDVRNRIRGD